MKIGIKYCGGCNPRYDRKKIAERLREDFPRAEILSASEPVAFDVVVVICGCHSQCAAHAHLEGRWGKVVLAEEQDYEKLRLLIAEYETEDKE